MKNPSGTLKKKKPASPARRTGFRRKVTIWIVVLVAFLALILARGLLLGRVGKFLVKQDPLERADLAVVLAGEYWDRARAAADVYRGGYTRRILLSKELRPVGYEEMLEIGIKVSLTHEVGQKILSHYGVPSSAVMVVDEEANSTYQEAQLLQRYVQAQGVKSVIVITSAYHTRRACMIIASQLGKGVRVICHPSKYGDFYPTVWWRHRKQARYVLLEYEKLFFYGPVILRNWLFS